MTSFPSGERDLARETAAEGEIAHASAGAGPTLLFVHSGIADRRMWAPQVAAFARSFRCICLDLRGFGESGPQKADTTDHDDLAVLLDSLGADRAVVIASSYGGNVAVDFALTQPGRVAGLVLAATLAGMTEPSSGLRRVWEETEAALEAGELDRGVELELQAWVDGPRRAPNEVDPGVREQVRAMNRAIWERAAGMEQVESDAPPIDRVDRLGEIVVPALLIEGELDQPDVAESMHRLAERIPNAELRAIAGAAHFPNLERPDEFNALALAFLERIDFEQ